MGILKHYFRNRACPEGSIIEGYATKEVVEFCLDYMKHIEPIGVPLAIHDGKLDGVGMTGKIKINPIAADCEKEHFHVLQHIDCVTPFIEEHIAFLKQLHSARKSVGTLHNLHFNSWFRERLVDVHTNDPVLASLARGPTWQVRLFQGYKNK
jgi:hypothetical protein